MQTSRKTGDVLLPCGGSVQSSVEESTSVARAVKRYAW